MTKKNRSFKNNFVPILALLLFIHCKSADEKIYKSIYCDYCELAVLKEALASDSVKIFYKDYSSLDNITNAIVPIDNRYLRTIDTRNFIGDTSIFNHFESGMPEDYRKSIQLDTILKSKNYPDFETAIVSIEKIKELGNQQKGGKYIRISKPVFNADRTFALLEVDYNCFGQCGEGYTYVLTKKSNSWMLYKKILRWVS
jgi:hypothetical protein